MNLQTGKIGEKYASHYLVSKRYHIVETNFFSRFGEIDIIAQKAGKLHFVEVKTRRNSVFGEPEEAFNHFKSVRLYKTIMEYFKIYKNQNWQIDFIAICLNSFDDIKSLRHYNNVSLF